MYVVNLQYEYFKMDLMSKTKRKKIKTIKRGGDEPTSFPWGHGNEVGDEQ